jgi:hypothetical protein
MQHDTPGMLSLSRHAYSRPHSAAWITPAGKFILIDKKASHDDYASDFPEFISAKAEGKIERYTYPSNFAVEIGYAKVSNPFEILLTNPERKDPRLRTMAEFTAGAIIEFDKTAYPAWLEIDFDDRPFPLRWPFRLTMPGRQLSFDPMSVGDFIGDYGSYETLELVMNRFEGRMNESLLRKLIKRMLRG